jgi:hypothetical protein
VFQGALSAVTTRLKFATFVLKLPIRSPVLVAKAVTSLAAMSGERISLGIGTSPWPEDFEATGENWPSRGARTDEMIEIIRGLLSDEQFYGHWHGSHSLLTAEIHPFRQYIRNSVARRLTPEAAAYRGIVEERVAELEDALDMLRLFRGSPENIRKGIADVDAFLDRAQISATLMSEYILAS